jgi:F-type H+-transporting ATPase subunit b
MLLASLGAAVAPSSPIDVDVDATFVVQLVLFVVLTLILKPVLFDPMLKLFEERERRTDGAKKIARETDEKSSSALTTYEEGMAKARASGAAERERVRAEGIKREQEILAAVRAATSKVVDEGKLKAHAEAAKVRAVLQTDAQTLARDLATRVLGREVQP